MITGLELRLCDAALFSAGECDGGTLNEALCVTTPHFGGVVNNGLRVI